MGRIAIALAVALATAAVARAGDHVILGRKLLLSDPAGNPRGRKVIVVAKEGPASPDVVVGDPSVLGASVTVFAYGGTASEQTFTLPAVGWRPVRGGFTYSGRTPGGAVRKVVLTRNAAGTVTLSLTAVASGGPLAVAPPAPGDTGGFVLDVPGGDRYCATLGGAAGGTEMRDDAQMWLVRNATAEACAAPAPTTTTTTSTSVTTSSSSSSSSTTSSSTTSSSTTSSTTTSASTSTSSSSSTTSSTTTSTSSSTSSVSTTSTSSSSSTASTTSTTTTTSSTTSTTSTSSSSTTTTSTSTTSSTTTPQPCNPDGESYAEPAFYRSLAYRWAPLIMQDTAGKWNADFIGRVDFDNDWVGNDNWQNLPNAGIAPYLYYDVVETSTHWFIFYHTFHPRDWDDVFFGTCGPFSDCHENDTENLFMMIQKDGSTYGRFRAMETEAHTSFYQYALANDGVSNGTGPDADDVDDDPERGFSLFIDTSVGVNDPRPAIYIESKGHGICDWWDNNGPYCVHPDDKVGSSGNDGVMYYPSATATPTVPANPSGGQWFNFKYPYQLVSLWDDVWVLRSCLGNGKAFDAPFTYPGVSGVGTPSIGGAMDGDDYSADAGTAWWAQAHGNLAPGDWTMDPARTVLRQLTFAEPVDTTYVYNPFLGIR